MPQDALDALNHEFAAIIAKSYTQEEFANMIFYCMLDILHYEAARS